MHIVRWVLLPGLIVSVGCQLPVPARREVRELRVPGRVAITVEAAADNSRLRLEAWETYAAGVGRVVLKLPASTIDGAPLPRYLVIDRGTATLVTDYRDNRLQDKPAVDRQPVTSMRLGYFDRGRFVETNDMPPPGRELVFLLQVAGAGEVRF